MRWYIAVLLILLAALLLDAGLLAYSMYVLLGLLLLTRFLARSWINNLSAQRAVAPARRGDDGREEAERATGGLTADVGDRIKVRVTVTNGGRLPAPWVLLEDLLPPDALDRRFPRLKVKGQAAAHRHAVGRRDDDAGILRRMPDARLLPDRAAGNGERRPLRAASPLPRGRRADVPAGLPEDRAAGRLRPDLAAADRRRAHDPPPVRGSRRASPASAPTKLGDPLSRVHWRATARTGQLHSKVHEPSTLSGATVLLDFHSAGYPARGEPFRSELAVTAALALANAVYEMGQQVGLVTNGRDAADRLRLEGWRADPRTRQAARAAGRMSEESHRLRPQIVETRRGVEQLQRMRETLARVELSDGLTFADLITETTGRLPRDATIAAVLPDVTEATAAALGGLRRAGRAITVVLIQHDPNALETSYGRLIAEGVRDVRHLKEAAEVPDLCRRQVDRSAPYSVV